MAGYVALPNELKDIINLSQKDISRLSRTSKFMRKALLPQLYKRISLSWEAFKPPPRISGILGAIVQSPDVAEMVKELGFHGKGYREHVSKPERKRRPTRKSVPEYLFEAKPKADRAISGSKPLLEKARRSMKLSENEWRLVPGGGDELDLIIATIIVHCPNLKVLFLGADFLHQNTVFPKVFEHFLSLKTGSLRSALTKLERVYLAQDIPAWYNRLVEPLVFPLSSCLPFLYLPSLETFSAPLPDSIGFSRPPPPPTEWPTTTLPVCTILKLDLHMTRAKPATLTFILAQTPHLRSLHYNYWCRSGERLDCAELRNALDSVGPTLTELIISFEPFTTEAEDIDMMGSWTVNAQALGSLVSLSHLTKLEIALPILLGWNGDAGLGLEDVFPSGLEELCLRDDCMNYSGMIWDEERTIEEVGRWLKNKAWEKCTPNIKQFGLRLCRSEIEEWGAQSRNILMDLCGREGLEFWFEKQHPDHEWNTSKEKYDEVDNPLRYPLQGK